MNLTKVDKKFVSEADKYLRAFNQAHEKTPSQLAEINKHERVFKKRDVPSVEKANDVLQAKVENKDIWEDF